MQPPMQPRPRTRVHHERPSRPPTRTPGTGPDSCGQDSVNLQDGGRCRARRFTHLPRAGPKPRALHGSPALDINRYINRPGRYETPPHRDDHEGALQPRGRTASTRHGMQGHVPVPCPITRHPTVNHGYSAAINRLGPGRLFAQVMPIKSPAASQADGPAGGSHHGSRTVATAPPNVQRLIPAVAVARRTLSNAPQTHAQTAQRCHGRPRLRGARWK
jgi:hypothetical protein